jgi:antitoxin CptB
MTELNRLRWRCRRGLLELDIVLERFLERHYPALSGSELEEFKALLGESDATLWEMISTTSQSLSDSEHRQGVLALLRQC